MDTKLDIITERIDDFVLLIRVMMRLGGSAGNTGSAYTTSLETGRAELGMGGDDLAGAHHIARRSPEVDSTGLGEASPHDVGRDDGFGNPGHRLYG